MGSCCFPRNSVIYRIDTITNNRPSNTYSTEIKEKEKDSFIDFPEIPDKYTGIGIKRIKAYKCDLHIDELNNLRYQFWELKIMINERWKILRQACYYDNDKCGDYLAKNGFWTINGCINECSDYTKYIYRIPNYCIDDPYFEKELLPIDTDDILHQKIISICLTENDEKCYIEVNESTTGKEVKERYCKEKEMKIQEFNIRLFFGGNEIKDEHYLYQHKVMNNYTIQIHCNKVNME